MRWNRISLCVLGVIVTGCASSQPALDAHSKTFGEATAHNITAQRIAPTAEDKANTFIPSNQARQKLAREAYENGQVKDPVSVGTTE